MKTIVFAEHHNGKFTKSSLEAVSYASAWSASAGGTCIAVTYGNIDASVLGTAGASEVWKMDALNAADGDQVTKLMLAAQKESSANAIVLSHDLVGKSVAPRLSVRLNAGLVSGATAIPAGNTVKKNVTVNSELSIVTVLPNSYGVNTSGTACAVNAFNAEVGTARVRVKEVRVEESESIPLPEADKVVSAGRGMKGPENWGMIEELAKELNAATACSRPVSDIGWRPHHEHVGQTGIAIRPNLYIAVGISGAIQHLAGVNGSKVIVVINKDAEAPFFKAADYGIVGDAFEVVPQLIAAAKAFNATK